MTTATMLGVTLLEPEFGTMLEKMMEGKVTPFVSPEPIAIPVAGRIWFLREIFMFISIKNPRRIIIRGAGTYNLDDPVNVRAQLELDLGRLQRDSTINFAS